MFRLKSRSVLCTPSSGLSRALGALHVDDDEMKSSGVLDADDARAADDDRAVADDAAADDDECHGFALRAGAHDRASTFDADDARINVNVARAGPSTTTTTAPSTLSASLNSQEFGGPDFITPADAQFDAYGAYGEDGAMNKENFRGARSPCALSPTRHKRPRFGLEIPSQGAPTLGTQECGASQPWSQPSQSQGDFRVPRNREPMMHRSSRHHHHRLPRAATSPPCARNVFLPPDEQPPETSAHGRPFNCTSAAQLATMSRFRADFVDLGCIARGGFSKVHRVVGRLDGRRYAVKRTDTKLTTEREKNDALREVHVLASLVTCADVVRYHSAWWENDHLYIQMELCDRGCAASLVAGDARMNEGALARCLRDVAAALTFAHDRGIAHMDVKPDNIFIHGDGSHKLGDWGRCVAIAARARGDAAVDEGDARYLPLELLNDDFSALDRADVFSLGVSIYELATAVPLPSSGEEYRAIRRGVVDARADVSPFLRAVVVACASPTPASRPSARELFTTADARVHDLSSTTST